MAAGASAQETGPPPLAPETIGRIERLATPPDSHWVFVSDPLLERVALVDLDTGRMLGVVDGGWGITMPLVGSDGRTLLVPETHYSRGSRGERTDVVTFYDLATLAPTGEVVLPPKRALNALPSANAALSDDGRFLAVFNMTPASSLSIVDVEERRLADEIGTPGCAVVYGAGPRRFAMLCSDGAMLAVELDERGGARRLVRSEPFFDPARDPVTEKAARLGDTWLFVSFEGRVHPVDVSGEALAFPEPWSLVDEADRADSWRVGGMQHLATHEASGSLYALMHQGGPDTHKEDGRELWVFDVAERRRRERMVLRSPGLTYLGVPLHFGEGWLWPFDRLYDALLFVAGLGVGAVAVTPDAEPLIVTSSEYSGSLAIYDGRSGEFRGRVTTGNATAIALLAPFGGGSPR